MSNVRFPTYLLGGLGGIGGSAPLPILDVDFTAFTMGFQDSTAFQANTFTAPVKANLALLRYYNPGAGGYDGSRGETVQDSTTTLLRSALSVQTNIARIGNRTATASKRGLVIEHNVTQQISGNTGSPNGTRDLTLGNWVAGTGVTTAAYADSPDGSGTGCSHTVCDSGEYAPYRAWASDRTFAFCLSAWEKALSGTARLSITNSATTAGEYASGSGSGSWGRFHLANGVTPRRYFDPADGKFYAGIAGWPAAIAFDVLIDYCQLEAGMFPTEAIATSSSVRRGDQLNYSTGSALVAANGQLKMYARFSPKFATTMQVMYCATTASDGVAALGWYLFSWGATAQNYAYIKESDKKVYVKIANGAEYVSTSAIVWAQYDEVEIYIAVGSNVASVLKYRVNAGAWTDLTLATISDVPVPSTVCFFRNSVKDVTSSDMASGGADTGQLPCWLHRLTVHNLGAPAGV